MEENEKYKQIEQYLNKEMADNQKAEFERQLRSDEALAQELRLHRELQDGLKGENFHRFREALTEVNQNWEGPSKAAPTPRRLHLRYLAGFAIAACLLALVVFKFLPSTTPPPGQLFAEHFSPYAMVLNERSATSDSQTDLLQQATQLYNRQDFQAAAAAFRQLQQSNPNALPFRFYEAVSYLPGNEAAKAIPLLEDILKGQAPLLGEQSRWYLALAHLKNNQPEQARTLLAEIKEGQYQHEAAALLLRQLKPE